jgi:hypothetical protein
MLSVNYLALSGFCWLVPKIYENRGRGNKCLLLSVLAIGKFPSRETWTNHCLIVFSPVMGGDKLQGVL